jgi:hypothetical protein
VQRFCCRSDLVLFIRFSVLYSCLGPAQRHAATGVFLRALGFSPPFPVCLLPKAPPLGFLPYLRPATAAASGLLPHGPPEARRRVLALHPRRSRLSQPTLGFASPDFIFVLVFVPVRPLPQVPRPSSILGEARRRPSGRDLESPASFVLSEHRTAGCRFVLRALGFGAAGWLSVRCSRLLSRSASPWLFRLRPQARHLTRFSLHSRWASVPPPAACVLVFPPLGDVRPQSVTAVFNFDFSLVFGSSPVSKSRFVSRFSNSHYKSHSSSVELPSSSHGGLSHGKDVPPLIEDLSSVLGTRVLLFFSIVDCCR